MLFGQFKEVADLLYNRYKYIITNTNITTNIPAVHNSHKYNSSDSIEWDTDDRYYAIMDAAHNCFHMELEVMATKEISDELFVKLYETLLTNYRWDKILEWREYNRPDKMNYDTLNFSTNSSACFNCDLGDLKEHWIDENGFLKKIEYNNWK